MEAAWVDDQKKTPCVDVFTSYLNVPGGVVVRTIVEDLDGRAHATQLLVPGARVVVRDGVVRLEPEPLRVAGVGK